MQLSIRDALLSILLISVACLLPIVSTQAVEPATLDLVQPADGPPFSAKLSSANAEGVLQFKVEGQAEPRSIKLRDLVRCGEWRKIQAGAQILLHDGSFLIADVLKVTPEQVIVDSINGLGEVKLPRAAIRAIVLQPTRWKPEPLSKTAADAQHANETKDQQPTAEVILANGDRRTGTLAGWENDALQWQSGEQKLRVPLASVVSIVFSKLPVSLDAPAESSPKIERTQAWLGFSDGSRILANSIVSDKSGWRIKLAAGGELNAELDALIALQTINGRAICLSDLTPAGYKSIPWLTTIWDYQRDRNVIGSELNVTGSLALKGLGMHSASRITYDLGKQYERFAARVGIDDSTEGRGHALAKVYGDRGDGKWELLHETPALDGGAPPVVIDLDTRDLQRLALVIDFAGDGDAGDHVDWLDARVIRKAESPRR